MGETLRIGVLGMAHDHLWDVLGPLAEVDGVELVGGADPDPVLRDRFKEKSDCRTVYDDFETLIDREKPDGVLVYTPTAFHADVVEMVAPRGIYAMVEKPMAASLEQSDRMLVAARKAGTMLMVNWPTA